MRDSVPSSDEESEFEDEGAELTSGTVPVGDTDKDVDHVSDSNAPCIPSSIVALILPGQRISNKVKVVRIG